MAEPDDMILPLLREMRSEIAALHLETTNGLDMFGVRLGRLEHDLRDLTATLAARDAAVRASRRRPLAGSSA